MSTSSKKNAVIYLLIIFITVEICLQVLALTPADNMLLPNPLTHHEYRPNIKFLRGSNKLDRFFTVINRINSIGIRGPEVKDKVAPRTLFIGDSFIQADEISFEDTFSEKLNRHFQGELEFIAHGIGSWAPTTEFSWIYHKGMSLSPDAVTIFVCANDFYRDKVYNHSDVCYQKQAIYQGEIPVKYQLEAQKLEAQKSSLFNKAKNTLKKVKTVRLAYKLAYKCYRLIALRNSPKRDLSLVAKELTFFSQDATQWPRGLKESTDVTIKVLENLNNYLKERSVEFSISLVPLGYEWENENIFGKEAYGWHQDFTVSQRGLENYLKAKLAQLNINYIDLHTAFRKRKLLDYETHLFFEKDPHWNKNGHQLIFETLRNYYSRRLGKYER